MTKLGLIVLANDSGLGNQTRRLTYMLKPERILAIDSTPFSKNTKQHFDWYSEFKGYKCHGFPNNHEIDVFIEGLTHVIVCENPLNMQLMDKCNRAGVKLYIQSNYEFCDHLNKDLALPTQFLMPSHWKIQEMKERFGDDKVDYLPPPIDPNEFKEAREENFAREGKKRFLHVVGTLAANDRNGTLDLLEAIKLCKSDFELVIRSQRELPPEYMTDDRRVSYVMENVTDPQDMYRDFDAMILPRRYGGLCLSCDEGLMSGLPVIMPDISPNNELLPKSWLVPAFIKGEFFTRINLKFYQCDIRLLAEKIDWMTEHDFKAEAFEIGYNAFSPSVLKPLYDNKLRHRDK